jgi:hypothetical protein
MDEGGGGGHFQRVRVPPHDRIDIRALVVVDYNAVLEGMLQCEAARILPAL